MPTPVIVQSASGDASSSGVSSFRVVFDNPTADDNSIVVPVAFGSGSYALTITSVEDDAGNEYVHGSRKCLRPTCQRQIEAKELYVFVYSGWTPYEFHIDCAIKMGFAERKDKT